MKEILSLVEHIEITMEGVKTQRDKTQQEIDRVVEDIFGRLNDQLRTKLQKLTGRRKPRPIIPHLLGQAYSYLILMSFGM